MTSERQAMSLFRKVLDTAEQRDVEDTDSRLLDRQHELASDVPFFA
jgi:hypothetical protein